MRGLLPLVRLALRSVRVKDGKLVMEIGLL